MRPHPFLALGLTLFGLSSVAMARDDNDRGDFRGPARVTFYEHADFRGGSLTLEVGQGLENLTRVRLSNGEGMNDRISSIRIEGDAEVIAFQDAGFRGGMRKFSFTISDLNDSAPGWNDAISSLRVEPRRGDRGRDRDDRDFQRVDRIIQRSYRDVLGRDPDERGLRSYRGHLLDDGWTEEQLRHSLRESPEFRQTADLIITRAFGDLLGRIPSRGERRKFTEHMIEDSWTEADVRNALERSDEYRRRPRVPERR